MNMEEIIIALKTILLNETDSLKIHQLFKPILEELNKINEVSFDEIDGLLYIADELYWGEQFETYTIFIMACPHKFMITYANNTEKIADILLSLQVNKCYNIYNYIYNHIYKTQLQILKEHYPHGIFYTDEHGEDKRIFF
jgi:hypothetical protein